MMSVAYARGFKVPTKLDIEKALGNFDADNDDKKVIFTEKFVQTFDSLPVPKKPTDWLAQYAEKGQSYMEFSQLARTLNTPSSLHRKTIYLTVFGPIDTGVFNINALLDYTERFFQSPVKLINPFTDIQWNNEKNQWMCAMNLTSGKNRNFNLRTRYHNETKHSQICVTGILNLLKKVVPLDARCLVAVTMYDLYGDDTDLFIAGLAMGNCRVATFSLFRYDPNLTFNESDWFGYTLANVTQPAVGISNRQSLLLLRACRLFTHEICHILGIDHCIYYSCLMNGSGDLDEDYSQPLFECPIDCHKLLKVINFNISERYENLLEFYVKHNFTNEICMMEKKLDVIKSMNNFTPSYTTAKRKRTGTTIQNSPKRVVLRRPE